MENLIITNNNGICLQEVLSKFGDEAEEVKIAAAFFSDSKYVTSWLKASKKIDLLISLRAPTNYYELEKIHAQRHLNIHFLGDDFHSKIYIFYKNRHPFACIIGSSNFTQGGLCKNIETNAILTENKYLNEINVHFTWLWEQSYLLQPSDLEKFKEVYDRFLKRSEQTKKEQKNFQKDLLTNRTQQNKKKRIAKVAVQYFKFWLIVNEIKEEVSDISQREYPNVPVYLTVDHFWHWIKTVWSKENSLKPKEIYRSNTVRELFQDYCNWDKEGSNYTKQMGSISKNLFSKLLSEEHIDHLLKKEAKVVYGNLHSGAMRTRRFNADDIFVKENSIKKIRKSLKYLLYANDDLELRISNLCVNPSYKLNQLSKSGIQEILGWVKPDVYPIRNEKANEALRLLGYYLD